jgi:hypothetical protein
MKSKSAPVIGTQPRHFHESKHRGLFDLRPIFQLCMSAGQFDQFGDLQAYERLSPNILLLYFPEVVVVVNLVEEEFIVLRAEEPSVPEQGEVDE